MWVAGLRTRCTLAEELRPRVGLKLWLCDRAGMGWTGRAFILRSDPSPGSFFLSASTCRMMMSAKLNVREEEMVFAPDGLGPYSDLDE